MKFLYKLYEPDSKLGRNFLAIPAEHHRVGPHLQGLQGAGHLLQGPDSARQRLRRPQLCATTFNIIVETKGREDTDVPLKMARLKQWCEDINQAQDDVRFDFVFVDEEGFQKYHPSNFADVVNCFREYKD